MIKIPKKTHNNVSKNKALFIGDSYGAARKTFSNTVELDETWSELLVKKLSHLNWICDRDFKTYRCLIECLNIIKIKNKHYDVIVIGAGIVDIFPRTLPYKLSRSQNIILKIFRVFVRSIRNFWLKNIYWKSWFEMQDIDNAVMEVLPYCRKLILLTLPPLVKSHTNQNPGAQDIMDQFNFFIKQKANDNEDRIHCIDICKLMQDKGIDLYLDSKDSHYNKAGNKLAAEYIEIVIKRIC